MATTRQKKAIAKVVENGGIVSKAMVESGYSPLTAKTPSKLTDSKAWSELMDKHLNDNDLAKKHNELLGSTRLDHMVFPPLRSKDEETTEDEEEVFHEGAMDNESLSDQDIIDLLETVNCKVKKIVHGEMQRHVYFWSADSKARKEALDMAYKLKGRYVKEQPEPPSPLNATFVQIVINPPHGTKNLAN